MAPARLGLLSDLMALAALAAAFACSDDETDPVVRADGGGSRDAVTDAAAPDASGPDAGGPDAEVIDAGSGAPCETIGTALLPGRAPERRGDTSLSADETCGRLFMFSGDNAVPQSCNTPPSKFVNDLHVYDTYREGWYELSPNGDWTAEPPTAPIPRARLATTWDEARGRLVVFGGRHRTTDVGDYDFPSDVWAFAPKTNEWSLLAPDGAGPAGRMGMTLHADPARDRIIVVFGAREFVGLLYDVSQTDDVWAFDLSTNQWTELAADASPSPPARVFHYAALDTKRRRLWVFSGSSADPFRLDPRVPDVLADLWFLDLETEAWSIVGANHPTSRFRGTMAYDEVRDQLVLVAGHDNTALGNNSEVYTYDIEDNRWTLESVGDILNPVPSFDPEPGQCNFPGDFAVPDLAGPERREAHMFTLLGDEAYLYGGRTDCGVANDTWRLSLETFAWEELNRSFSGMTCPRNGRDDCDEPSVKMCD